MSDRVQDLLLTDAASGRKMLVDAFGIAAVHDLGPSREIVLRDVYIGATVPGATPEPLGRYFASPVFTFRVAETLEQIAEMRSRMSIRGAALKPS